MKLPRIEFSAWILVLALGSTPWAHAGSPVFSIPLVAPEKLSKVRGSDSIVEELNMGPNATELWRKIQLIASDADYLFEFPKLAALLDLGMTDPVDAVSYKLPGFQTRRDLMDRHYGMMQSVIYGVGGSNLKSDKRNVQLIIDLDINKICITKSEVKRIYGDGNVGIPSHGGVLPAFLENPTGIGYSEAYGAAIKYDRRSPLIFTYAPSGCASAVHFIAAVDE